MSQTVTADSEEQRANTSQILDEDIERARKLVGADTAISGREHVSRASEDSIRNFSFSAGDDNPLFTDPDYAARTRWGMQIAPNLMAAIIGAPMMGDRLPAELRQLKKGLFQGIHVFVSGSEWNWYRPVRPGDVLYGFAGEDGVEVKPSEYAGRTVTKFLRTVKINQNGEVVGVYRKRSILSDRTSGRERGKYSKLEAATYTDEQLAEIDQIYLGESRRGAEPRYFEDVEVGEPMGRMAKGPLTLTDMVVFHAGGYGFQPYGLFSHRLAYANRKRIPAFYAKNGNGVPDVIQRVHWDQELATSTTGNPAPYDYGVMRETWLHHFMTDWAGDDAFIVRQYDEIRKFNYVGDTQIITGTVTRKHEQDGRFLVDVRLEARSQRDVVTAICDGTISLPSREHGPAVLPDVPLDLNRRAIEMFRRHTELSAKTG